MMFSEDYVQSMVTAREAAALVQDVERIRVVHERFAAVPSRRWWRRIAVGRAQRRVARAGLGAAGEVQAAEVRPAEARTAEAAAGSGRSVQPAQDAGAGASRELTGSRR